MKFKLALLCGLALAGANAMACYTVYDGNSRVVYQGAESPVDMTMQLHEGLRARGFPAGSRMVFDRDSCGTVPMSQQRTASRDVPLNTIHIVRDKPVARVAEGPLLTEPSHAARLGLPHTVIASNIAVVPRSAAALDRTPAMTVVPAEAVTLASAPNTNAMGAGPASYNTRVMGAAPARTSAPVARNITVITEYRDGAQTVQKY